MDNYPDIRSAIDARLSQSDFKVWRRVTIDEGTEADLFASRILWRVIRIPQHVFVLYKDSPDQSDFERFYDIGLRYAKRAFPTLFPINAISTYVLVTGIAADNISSKTVAYVTKKPEVLLKGISGFCQFPVLIHANTGKVDYFRDTTWFGVESYPLAQDIVQRYIEGL